MIIPLQFVLLQALTILLTIMIEAYLFNWKFKINRQKSIELSCLINFTSYLISWFYFLGINWVMSYRQTFKLNLISYAILGKISDLALVEPIYSFIIGCLLFNFVMIVTSEFLIFEFASKLILIKQGRDEDLSDFLVNIIRENNGKKLATILVANLYSYLVTMIIYSLSHIRNILT